MKRLSTRNLEIQKMLTDAAKLKSFYRFAAQNPHIDLHDASQIIISRPKATVCYPFEEWDALGRRVFKGRKGIPYYDREGNKLFVFDSTDTYGENRYKRDIYPLNRLLLGLDTLNETENSNLNNAAYHKIHSGVAKFMRDNNYLSNDKEYSSYQIEGTAYLLYCKTGFPKDDGIHINALNYSLTENAQIFKDAYVSAYSTHKV